MDDKWTLEKFIAMCVQEEERIKCNNCGVNSINKTKHHQKRKNFAPKPYTSKKEDKGKAASMSSDTLWTRINASGARRGATIGRITLSS
jgi:hypothetical protein